MQLLRATPASPPGIESKSGFRGWHEETAAVDELCDIVEDQQDGVLKVVGRGRLGQGVHAGIRQRSARGAPHARPRLQGRRVFLRTRNNSTQYYIVHTLSWHPNNVRKVATQITARG